MSSLKQLVQPECGQSNALVDFSNKILSSLDNRPNASSASKQLLPFNLSKKKENEFLREYFAEYNASHNFPSTFNMRAILQEINRTAAAGENSAAKLENDSSTLNSSNSNFSNQWALEFLKENNKQQRYRNVEDSSDKKLIAHDPEFTNLDIIWQKVNNLSNSNNEHRLKWSVDYLNEFEQQRYPGAVNIDNVDDMQIFSGSDYRQNLDHRINSWADEYADYLKNEKIDTINDGNVGEFENVDKFLDNFYDEKWGKMNDSDDGLEIHWTDEYNMDLKWTNQGYKFKEDNPYDDVVDPLEEGKKLLRSGDLFNAVLNFEAAVKKEPENAEAWQFLGQAQAENEHETKTIAALKKCLELDPRNLTALLSLSIAYTNESLYDKACRCLLSWLKANDKYANYVQHLDDSQVPITSSFVDRNLFHKVEEAFFRAANEHPSRIDPDLQNAFGILYNMSGDLDRAADCFRTALMVKPEDARLWNRLGATLANSNRSPEAISAYRKALEFYPGFVRARYNLGVSCLNLGSHAQAIDHFLSALTLQQNGLGPAGRADMSQTIWGTLRVATATVNRPDLMTFVDQRDFDGYRRAFDEKPVV